MTVEYTSRGFAVLRLRDADDDGCSLQDSSLASEACVWFGRDDQRPDQIRMHLTQDMAAVVLARLRQGRDGGDVVLLDRYGSTCRIGRPADGADLVEAGVAVDFEGRRQEAMRLSDAQIAIVAPLLEAFASTGSIDG